jgi:3-oxoacyl-[acyl-carrier protein] reductase
MSNFPPGDAQLALVTGAGSGIGRAVVARLVDDGFAIVALDRDAAGLQETAELADPDLVRPVVVDLSDVHATQAQSNQCSPPLGYPTCSSTTQVSGSQAQWETLWSPIGI